MNHLCRCLESNKGGVVRWELSLGGEKPQSPSTPAGRGKNSLGEEIKIEHPSVTPWGS